jgi:hypothetical protein
VLLSLFERFSCRGDTRLLVSLQRTELGQKSNNCRKFDLSEFAALIHFYWFEMSKNGKDCLKSTPLNEWRLHSCKSWKDGWPLGQKVLRKLIQPSVSEMDKPEDPLQPWDCVGWQFLFQYLKKAFRNLMYLFCELLKGGHSELSWMFTTWSKTLAKRNLLKKMFVFTIYKAKGKLSGSTSHVTNNMLFCLMMLAHSYRVMSCIVVKMIIKRALPFLETSYYRSIC